jgi:hypothetical protein
MSYADLDLVEDDDEDLDLVEDDDEEDETVEDPHTLVELMEPANEGKEVDDSKRNLPKTRPLSFFTTLRSTSPKRKAKVEISEDDYSDMPRLTTVSPCH